MKTKISLIVAASALLACAAIAQPQPPAPPAPPSPPNAPNPPMPPNPPGDRHEHEHPNVPKVPVTFLGVETSGVPKVVCDQLNLAKGFGLVVDYVVPNGPAATAGVQANDILKLLNDQILTEPEQLSKLIRSFPEGTTVTFTVLRKGQEQKIPVKLGKKEVPQRMSDMKWGDMDLGEMNGMMKDLGESMSGMKGDMIETAVMKAHEEVARAREKAEEARDQAREQAQEQAERGREQAQEARDQARERAQEQAERVREQAQQMRDQAQQMRDEAQRRREEAQRAREEARRSNGQISITRSDDTGLRTTRIDINKAQIVYADDKGELRLDSNSGKKILTAKDPQGRLLFSGPVETKEDLDKVPADVRQRYEQLQQNDLPAAIGAQKDEENDANDEDADDSDEDDSRAGTVEQVSARSLGWTLFASSNLVA